MTKCGHLALFGQWRFVEVKLPFWSDDFFKALSVIIYIRIDISHVIWYVHISILRNNWNMNIYKCIILVNVFFVFFPCRTNLESKTRKNRYDMHDFSSFDFILVIKVLSHGWRNDSYPIHNYNIQWQQTYLKVPSYLCIQ